MLYYKLDKKIYASFFAFQHNVEDDSAKRKLGQVDGWSLIENKSILRTLN